MSFERAYKVITYLLVVVGLTPLATSGEVPVLVVGLTFAAVVHSWFKAPPISQTLHRGRGWTLGTFIAALLCLFYGWASSRWLLASVFFALVMVVVRLYQGRTARDMFQLYGLTFIAIIAGAVVNPSVWFLFSFLAYVVLLVWALAMLHLQRDLERLEQDDVPTMADGVAVVDLEQEVIGYRTRGLVSRRFLAGTSILALGVFVTSLAFFFFFPRLGMGFFFGQGRKGQAVSGFSDKIELGHFGTIKDNLQIIMRVEIAPSEAAILHPLRMRGVSFDHYDGTSWTKTTSKLKPLPRSGGGQWRVEESGDRKANYFDRDVISYSVYVEPIVGDRRVVFGVPRLLGLEIANPRLDQLKRSPMAFMQGRVAKADIVTGRGIRSSDSTLGAALRYTAYSTPWRPSTRQLQTVSGAGTPNWVRAVYTQLPESLDPRIATEAARVTQGATTMHAKVLAVERYLLGAFQYTTQGGHNPSAPLSDFLFRRKAGHCEYFSSAMVVMLRSLGIPSRPANGFYGGDYNAYGGYYAVRQADAHSWVEVFYPGYGWLTFDPTPSVESMVPAEDGWWADIQEWFDSLKLRWYKWVVEYDLEKQLAFFTEIGKSIRGWFPSADEGTPNNSGKGWLEGLKSWVKDWRTWAWFAVPLILLVVWRQRLIFRFMAWLRRRRSFSKAPEPYAVGVYHAMLRRLARLGFQRRVSETPRELATRLERDGFAAADSVAYITAAFEQARYNDNRELDPQQKVALDAASMAVASCRAS